MEARVLHSVDRLPGWSIYTVMVCSWARFRVKVLWIKSLAPVQTLLFGSAENGYEMLSLLLRHSASSFVKSGKIYIGISMPNKETPRTIAGSIGTRKRISEYPAQSP